MRNVLIFLFLIFFLSIAIFIGSQRSAPSEQKTSENIIIDAEIPSVGSVQVLNGCCDDFPAAGKTAAFLRSRGFDVKNIDNATEWIQGSITWNLPFTIVASGTKDMNTAQQVAKALKTDKIILLRNDESIYDVVVYVGPDIIGDLIQ